MVVLSFMIAALIQWDQPLAWARQVSTLCNLVLIPVDYNRQQINLHYVAVHGLM
jgi:hypothetical protein